MSATSTRLAMITKELLVEWRETREYWKDAKSVEFERKYIDELITSVDSTVTVIEKLDNLMLKIRKDCE